MNISTYLVLLLFLISPQFAWGSRSFSVAYGASSTWRITSQLMIWNKLSNKYPAIAVHLLDPHDLEIF